MHSISFGSVVFSRKTEWQQVCPRAVYVYTVMVANVADPWSLQVEVIETEAFGHVLMLDGACAPPSRRRKRIHKQLHQFH